MRKQLNHTISKKLWANHSTPEKSKLFLLLIVLAVFLILALVNLFFQVFGNWQLPLFLSNLGIILTLLLSVLCVINGKTNCVLNLSFTIPIFIYAFYISNFNSHAPLIETVYFSLFWLLGGLFFLLYFANFESKVVLYSILSIITISFQLLEANRLFDSFLTFDPFIIHPILIFVLIFVGAIILRLKNKITVTTLSETLKFTNQSISKVLQDSSSSIAQIRAERDEEGNIVKLKIEKINNSFESNFKINLYEVQNQEAGYIFNLVFKNQFDLNKILLFDSKRTKEFHAKNLDRWFKVHVLKPAYNKFYLIFEDTTKNKNKITDLEANKKRYKVLLEAIPDIFFVIDKDGTYEDFVVKESDLFKIEDVDIIGSSIFDVGFPDNMAIKISECIKNCIKNNSIESIEYSLKTPNGTFLFEMRLAKLNARSVISVARDITKRKTAEFNLEKALVKAEESDRLKSAFLANLSHEIRTPLNIITHFTRMLADDEMQGLEKIELTDAISQNGKQLLNMIDNTIHLSKIETESVNLQSEFCDINSIIRQIYNHYLPILPESKDIKLKLKLDVPNTEFGFKTDAHLLKEVLVILVDNAVKYTQKGEILFGYEMIKNEEVKFYISDSGIGIPDEEKENIFSRFYRIKNNINETTSGSGLGLPIARHYVNLLGGKLEFESNSKSGTEFWFTVAFKEGRGFLRVVS